MARKIEKGKMIEWKQMDLMKFLILNSKVLYTSSTLILGEWGN